jgi:PAS domain S-box-containing protein
MQKPLQTLFDKLSQFISSASNALNNSGWQKSSTENNHLEEQLKTLSCAVEQSPSTIVITDIEGNIEYVNPKFTQLTGYTSKEAIGQNPRILKTDKTPPGVYECLWKTITSGKEWRGEFCNKKKNGEFYWESVSISPVKNEEGIITNFVAVKEDITERKKIEEKLKLFNKYLEQCVAERTAKLNEKNLKLLNENVRRVQAETAILESEEKYRQIISTATDAVMVFDSGTRQFIDVNKACEELYGYTREEFLNMKHTDITAEVEVSEKQIQEVIVGKLHKILLRYHRKKDGTVFPTEISTSSFTYKGRKVLCGMIRDITKRKQVEYNLKQSEDRYRDVATSMSDWVWEVDAQGKYIYASSSVKKILGYDQNELLGKTPFDLMSPEESARVAEIFLEISASKRPIVDLENWNVAKDGSKVCLLTNGVPMLNNEGRLLGYRGVDKDITVAKQANEKIMASLKEKEVLLEEVHHRVKNNLQIISSLLDMSSMQTQDQETIELFAGARSRVNAMSLVHSQLYESERFDEIDMQRHIHELSENLLRICSKEKTITLDIQSANVYLPVTLAVPCALVLNELISNSLKHAYIDRQHGLISIFMQQSNEGAILIKIKDDGVGISEKIDMENVNSLGLRLIRNIVYRQLHGTIRVVRNRGTEFTVEFKYLKEDS